MVTSGVTGGVTAARGLRRRGHFGSTRAHVLASCRYVATARSFLFDWETAISPTGMFIEDQTLFLPFTVAGETVDKILIYSRLTRRRPRDTDIEFLI